MQAWDVPVESRNGCPMCGWHSWYACFDAGGLYVEELPEGLIVDGNAGDDGEGGYVDFCKSCGCGVTSHIWEPEEAGR